MKVEISVPEAIKILKQIQNQPQHLFEMIRSDVKETVGRYSTYLMKTELTHFLGRDFHKRTEGSTKHRNGSHKRSFTLKGLGEVVVNVPRNRKGNFKSQVIPASKRYEKDLRHDLSMMFLAGVSTHTLSMLSKKLIGRSI